MSATLRHPSRAAARPEPAAHEEFLWDSGFHWGEWLEPGGQPLAFPDFVAADKADVATAYLAHSAAIMARIAAVLGRDEEARRYAGTVRERARRVAGRVRLRRRQAHSGHPGQPRPGPRLRPGAAAQPRPRVATAWSSLVRAAGDQLTTGFLATPYLLPVLADAGHLDVAYQLLFQDREPSWLTMVDRGATTMWEHWNGVDARGEAHDSLNHYAKGAVVSFLHRYVAGLDLPADPVTDGPAYRRFRVRPRPGGGITWARAAHESPYGRIEVRWSMADERLRLDLTVPPGTSAEVTLPGGRYPGRRPRPLRGSHLSRTDRTLRAQ